MKHGKVLKLWNCEVKSILFSTVFFILAFVYDEILFHITEFGNASVLFPVLFAVPAGALFGFVCDLFPEKITNILRYVLSAAVTICFGVQIVYFDIFKSFMYISQIAMGKSAISNFFDATLIAIKECLPVLLLLFVPVAALAVAHIFVKPNNRHISFRDKRILIKCGAQLLLTALLFLIAIGLLPLKGTGANSPYDNYHDNWVLDLSMEKLGLLTSVRIDAVKTLFNTAEEEDEDVPVVIDIPTEPEEDTEPEPEPEDETEQQDEPEIQKEYNIIEGLDFSALAEEQTDETVKKTFEYFAEVEPTKTNEYTGMFKGYNLIMITAESFSPLAVNEEYTPTLYKLVNSGFVFENFWTSYPSNTTNGEYSVLTGLFPDQSKPKTNGSFLYTANNHITMNMNIARWFEAAGIGSRAFHDHSAAYYGRNKTHTNLGYTFKGREQIGGLSGWPESDLVMMQRTIGEYINDDCFHTYYMTVSGHHNYKFTGVNSMAEKNKSLVADYPYSSSLKAYLACNIELDKALEYLISELDSAGKLANTVICLCPDHYPYGLTDREFREYTGHAIMYDGLERYQNNLIIWNSEMETVYVDKPCCTVDVLPTLLNLFGCNYDSRLYSGSDILSDSVGIAITSNQSFITDKFIYSSRSGKIFYLADDYEVSDETLDAYIQVVKNRFSIASNVLNHDIYAKLPEDVIADAQNDFAKWYISDDDKKTFGENYGGIKFA